MVKQTGGAERRQYIRAKRVLSVEFKLSKTRRKNADKGSYLSTTEDMSLGGVSFYTDQPYSVGDTLDVHVVMSGVLDIFQGPAKVVRVHRKANSSLYRVAVKFLKSAVRKRAAKSFKSAAANKTTKKKSSRSVKRV